MICALLPVVGWPQQLLEVNLLFLLCAVCGRSVCKTLWNDVKSFFDFLMVYHLYVTKKHHMKHTAAH